MPHIPELQQIQLVQSAPPPVLSQDVQNLKIEGIDLETQFTAFDSMNMNQHFKTYKRKYLYALSQELVCRKKEHFC